MADSHQDYFEGDDRMRRRDHDDRREREQPRDLRWRGQDERERHEARGPWRGPGDYTGQDRQRGEYPGTPREAGDDRPVPRYGRDQDRGAAPWGDRPATARGQIRDRSFARGEGDRDWMGRPDDDDSGRGFRFVNDDDTQWRLRRGRDDAFYRPSSWGTGSQSWAPFGGSSAQQGGRLDEWPPEAARRSRSAERPDEMQGRQGFAGRGPRGYQRSDERIREEISRSIHRR